MNALTQEQKQILKEIISNPASYGAFTGMIFKETSFYEENMNVEKEVDTIVCNAIKVKERIKKLSE